MRCPKCGFNQKDGFDECKKCGVIFANFVAAHPRAEAASQPIQYEEVENWTSQLADHRGKVILLLALLLPLGVSRFVFSGGAPDPLTGDVRPRTPVYDTMMKGKKTELGEMCMRSAMEDGSTEIEARANCYDDPDARKAIDKANKDHEKSLNILPADKIESARLRVKMDSLMPDDYEASGSLYLQLFDEKDQPAAATGKVELTCSNKAACHIMFPKQGTNAQNFIWLSQQDGQKFLVYQLGRIEISREQISDLEMLEIGLTFDKEVTSELKVQIEPRPHDEQSTEAGEQEESS